ncbi:MAG: PIG-L deacetylase family protein [Caulobacteraceae bacterium]
MKISRISKLLIILASIFLVLFVTAFFLREYISNYYVKYHLDDAIPPGSGSRVLVFAPHNDDEVLGAGILINKVLRNNGQVKIVMVTNGDGYRNALAFDYFNLNPKPSDYIKFGYNRQQETLHALKSLGLKEDNLIFLGYPDGGISYLWNTYWDKTNPYTSVHTQTSTSPYSNSYTKNVPYTGENLVEDITSIINDFKPTYIVYPHPNDRHPDHWAVNCFVKYALTLTGYSPDIEWLYLVHRGDWPTPMREEKKMYLVPPAALINIGTTWEALAMTEEDIEGKAAAIRFYKTQLRTLKPLLTAFERKNELLGVYPNFKIPSGLHEDTEIAPDDSNLAIVDPLQDALRLKISRSADISSVHAEISKSGNLHIFVQTDYNLDRKDIYHINMIFFSDHNTSRYDFELYNGKASLNHMSEQSVTDMDGITYEVKKNILHVVLPKAAAGNFDHLFINSLSSTEEHLLDKTAWRMLDRKQN